MEKSSKNSRLKNAPIDWTAVGRRIRVLRGIDMTQENFAARVGITQSYLSLIEHGHGEIGPAVLLAISREFKKSIEWLLTGSESK
jgi:transcriptional regulator with XRE-family HTH domain